MSTNTLSDFRPPFIIDIGTNTIKYTQPILNTCKLAKEVIKARNQPQIHSSKETQNDDIINANKIFDHKKCIDTLFTSSLYSINPQDTINFDYNKQHTFHEPKFKRFQHEAIFAGHIYNFDIWENIIKTIGKRQLDHDYFNKEQFNETPIIIMQDTLPLLELKEQVKEIYRILFEKFKAQYVMLCSSGMVNMFSHNISNGIVVDLGESKTSITPIHNGFACYNNSIHTQFLSGRTITAMMAFQDKGKMNDIDMEYINTSISYKEYYNKLKIKHEDNENTIPFTNDKETRFGHLNYLYTFPEVFRSLFRENMRCTPKYIEDFIYNGFNNKKFNTRSNIEMFFNEKLQSLNTNNTNNNNVYKNIHSIHKYNEGYGKKDIRSQMKLINVENWKEELNKIYQLNKKVKENSLSSDEDDEIDYDDEKSNYDMYLNEENDLVNNDEVVKFRQFSLSQLIANQMKLEFVEENEWKKSANIVFCGGVLNTPGMKKMLEEDVKSLFAKEVNVFFPDISDAGCAFYKGANYLSKLADLENVMISRRDYLELGEERLCYNYI